LCKGWPEAQEELDAAPQFVAAPCRFGGWRDLDPLPALILVGCHARPKKEGAGVGEKKLLEMPGSSCRLVGADQHLFGVAPGAGDDGLAIRQ